MDNETYRNIRRLKNLDIFLNLPDETLVELAAKMEFVELAKEQVLFERGAPGGALYILLQGWVKVITEDAQGSEVVLNHCGPGQAVGDTSLIDGEPYSNGVKALVPVKAVRLKREDLLVVLHQQPELSISLMRGLASQLRLATTYIEKVIEWSQRVAKGDYSFAMEQLNHEKNSIVTLSRTDEARASEFLAAFYRMVEGVQAREQELKKQVYELTIRTDEALKAQQVEELSQTDFFKRLKSATESRRQKK